MIPAEQFEIQNEINPTEAFEASSSVTDFLTPLVRNTSLFDEQYHTDSHGDSAVHGHASVLFDEQDHTSADGMRNSSRALFDEQDHTDTHGDTHGDGPVWRPVD